LRVRFASFVAQRFYWKPKERFSPLKVVSSFSYLVIVPPRLLSVYSRKDTLFFSSLRLGSGPSLPEHAPLAHAGPSEEPYLRFGPRHNHAPRTCGSSPTSIVTLYIYFPLSFFRYRPPVLPLSSRWYRGPVDSFVPAIVLLEGLLDFSIRWSPRALTYLFWTAASSPPRQTEVSVFAIPFNLALPGRRKTPPSSRPSFSPSCDISIHRLLFAFLLELF